MRRREREREKADRGKKVEAGKKAKEAKRYSKKKPAKMKKKQQERWSEKRKTRCELRFYMLVKRNYRRKITRRLVGNDLPIYPYKQVYFM